MIKTKAQRAVVEYALQYPGWHSFGRTQPDVEVICACGNLGLVELDLENRKFRVRLEAARRWLRNH